ncbi:MAG: HAD family hydrolase [Planctomycetota bacterium]
MPFAAVLFDLDGTLLDTIEDLTDSMNAALARLGFRPGSMEQCKHFVGDGMRKFAERALPEQARDAATIDRLVENMRSEYSNRWSTKTRPYEGIPELLGELTRRRLAMAVLSNKPEDMTRRMVYAMLPGAPFAEVRGAIDGVAKKPDPTAALSIARSLKTHPEQFLYVGDTGTDMQTAVAAGMSPVGVLWGFRDADELTDSGAETLIYHPSELLNLL